MILEWVPKRLVSTGDDLFVGNLEFRKRVIERGWDDPEYARAMLQASESDVIFWINTFVWTYNPRKKPFKKLPMVTWDFQDDAILKINAAIEEGHDLLGEKSRDMGFTWMTVCVFVWRVLFRRHETFLMGSRKEELVDGDMGRDQKTLFSKVDWLVKNLPGWMTPEITRNHMHLFNHDTGSGIDGESTNQDFGRGDRRTAIFLDEFPAVEDDEEVLSATADTTDCRIFCGTPRGARGAFYRLRQSKDVEKIRLHWSIHPEKSVGLYDTHEGRPRILDTTYQFPENYPFVADGRLRSPWYDAECRRRGSDKEVAQELDINYHGAGSAYFDIAKIEVLEQKCRPPVAQGHLDSDQTCTPIEFVPRAGGSLRLWSILPDARGKMPIGRAFTVGCDISAGTGASNSVASVIDCMTSEKVAEFTNPKMKPYEFAEAVVALCRWFNDAYLIWETGGPGHEFGDRVLNLGYRNIFFAVNEQDFSKKESDKPGWYPNPASKEIAFGEYRRALEKEEVVIFSAESLAECREYVYGRNNVPEHSSVTDTADVSGARKAHGDRVVADVLAWKGCCVSGAKNVEVAQDIPVGSYAWRRLQREQEAAMTGEWDGGSRLDW